MGLRDKIISKCLEIIGNDIEPESVTPLFEQPLLKEHGDLSLPCFTIAKKYRKSPNSIATELASRWTATDLATVNVIGGYLNFKYNPETLIDDTLTEILNKNKEYGASNTGEGKKVLVDYCGVNVGKPMHVGHIRSTILGNSILNILKFCGYKTYGINYLGDTGLHIGKLIYAINTWGDINKIRENPIKHFFDLYVKFHKEEMKNRTITKESELIDNDDTVLTEDIPLVKNAKEIVRKIENNDPEYIKQWQEIIELSNNYFQKLYDLLGIKFDEITGQSQYSNKGKEIALKALEMGRAKTQDGAIVYNLSKYNLPDKIILRSDGSSMYSTQDIGALITRYETHKFDKCIYVTGEEQKLYFQQIFAIIKDLGYDWADRCFHIPFGLLNLPEGKISTREGKVVFLEEVLNRAQELALNIVKEKNPELPDDIKTDVAKKVGIGAIKYMILSIAPEKNITFTWERALNLENNSGPYIQYSYARANSILRKKSINEYRWLTKDLLDQETVTLIKDLSNFPFTVRLAEHNLNPQVIAEYVNNTCMDFNYFYDKCRVIGSEQEKSRLILVKSFCIVISNAMNLLGIDLPEKM